MENLIIKNNSGSENVGSDVLLKVYELALLINGILQLSGNIVVPHAKQNVLNYFENNFPDLHITLTGLKYIDFADPVVAWHVAKSYDPDGIGITLSDLNSINLLTTSMLHNTLLTTFNELSLFTNITTIKLETFKDCTSLTSIGLDNITTIGVSAFENCTSLNINNIDLSNITTIGSKAFKGCTGLTSIDLSSLTTVGGGQDNGAFQGCTGLTTVTNLNKAGEYMFYGCTGLTSVGLNSNITSLPGGCFLGCTSLSTIDLSNITLFKTSCFNGCSSLGVGVDLDFDLDGKTFSSNCFKGTGYRSITLHETTKHNILGFSGSSLYDTFGFNMPNLVKFDLSDTKLTATGELYSNNMTTIIFPETYTGILSGGRSWGTGLKYVICLATNASLIQRPDSYWGYMQMSNDYAAYVPDAAYQDYYDYFITNSSDPIPAARLKRISELPSNITWYTKDHPATT